MAGFWCNAKGIIKDCDVIEKTKKHRLSGNRRDKKPFVHGSDGSFGGTTRIFFEPFSRFMQKPRRLLFRITAIPKEPKPDNH
jgi:hypothetical protein